LKFFIRHPGDAIACPASKPKTFYALSVAFSYAASKRRLPGFHHIDEAQHAPHRHSSDFYCLILRHCCELRPESCMDCGLPSMGSNLVAASASGTSGKFSPKALVGQPLCQPLQI